MFVNTRSAVGADVAVHLMIVEHLDPRACRVSVATNSRAVDARATRVRLAGAPGVRTLPMNLGYELSGRRGAGRAASAAANMGLLLAAAMRLSAEARARRVDVLHTTDRPRDALLTMLVASLSGRRSLIHLHVKWGEHFGRMTRIAVARCDALVAISQFVRGSLLAGGLPDSRIHVVLNATDASAFDPTRARHGAFRAQAGIARDAPLLLIAARIMVWKGHVDLVRALPDVRTRFPDVRLAIVGTEDALAGGGYTDMVRAAAREAGVEDCLAWVGWCDDMPGAFADADVVCVPSWEEPFGLVVTEAMAMERPVVAYDSGALPEIVEHGVDGILVPPREPPALAAAIVDMLSDRGAAQAMGRRAREKVMARFSPRRQADEVTEVYRRVCGG
ncbi:MAG: glycosyltransferase family 4 protein [Chthonomonadales bacterium]|nr:glycosyltransferase family 4 protein [Chthonomonadales bacterium]